jgi:uncharacterized repeat protein (TIGR03803 family)
MQLKKIGTAGLRAALIVAASALLAPAPASAHGLKVLYSFCALANCADGSSPQAALIEDAAGNLYGTATGGDGAYGDGGTIFRLRRGSKGFEYRAIYSFCSQPDCTDGELPEGGLVIDETGNLYGTTFFGGAQGQGEVFELSPGRKGWTLQVLYSFCPAGGLHCPDGDYPGAGLAYAGQQSGALYDGSSPLFGTASRSGAGAYHGVAYGLAPGKSSWSYQVIYNFCSLTNCADGANPLAPLIEDAAGNLYGTTDSGGNATGKGTAFELNFKNNSWIDTVLYSFCGVANCADGAQPQSGLAMDGTGSLYGVTLEGGNGAACGGNRGCGTVYRIVPNGQSSQETVLHAFCNRSNCPDGDGPAGIPVLDTSGNLFGTATQGGDGQIFPGGGGTLFEISGSKFQVLRKFCTVGLCTDGAVPYAGVTLDGAGHLFGTAAAGGANCDDVGGSCGIVYEFVPR